MAEAYEKITIARARVLRGLANGQSERQVAEGLEITLNGVRSHVEDLKEVTGCHGVRELGQWWREHRTNWVAHAAEAAGVGY